MPIKTRTVCCGFDPIIVRGYLRTPGIRALWWYLPDEITEKYELKVGDKVRGIVHAIYNPKAEKVYAPEERFEWPTSKETALAIVLPVEFIMKYRLTKFHFLEMTLDSLVHPDGRVEELFPGELITSKKFWPEELMKLHYYVDYIPP